MAKRITPKGPNDPKKRPTGSYPIGFARPPEHGKIKPGEVRNRWGAKGKPKPEQIDPFEFAASQLTTITLDGEKTTVTVEVAAAIVNMHKALAGDPRAYRNVLEERWRRRRDEPVMIEEEIRQQIADEARRKELSARIIAMLDDAADDLHNSPPVDPDIAPKG